MSIPALYWTRIDYGGASIESDYDVWNAIKLAFTNAGLQNVKQNPADVSGHTSDTFVAGTFVKLDSQDYVIIIMTAGAHAAALRDELYKIVIGTGIQ
jgi:hypothetical protein